MFSSIRAKLGAIYFGFLLLGVGSVSATFVTVNAQASDALVVNLAGRQRMLTQEMTKAVLGIARDPTSNYRAELDTSANLFDHTLAALLDGGAVPYGDRSVTLPPTTDAATRAQLEVVAELWDQFQQKIETVQTAKAGSTVFAQAVGEIESLSPVILQKMDRAVQLYEAATGVKLARLRAIQALFAVSAVGLLIAGYLVTQRTIVLPISTLEAATRRIASGDLTSPVGVTSAASDEVHTLAQSFDDMCHELTVSRLELEQWTAKLESRVERRTEQLAILFEVSAEVSSKLEIHQVLELVVEKTRYLARGEIAVLCLLDPSGGALTIAATSGPAEALSAHSGAAIQGPALRAAYAGKATILPKDCDCHLLRPQYRRSHLTVPLRARDQALGVLCVGHRAESRFGEEESRLLTLLANAGAIALENARLYEQAEQAATLAERERIVAEIHDGLAQTLGFLDLRLGAVAGLVEDENLAEIPGHLTLMRRTVKQANHEVRRLMTDLRTGPQPQRTLAGLLEQIVERFDENQGMEIELQVETKESIQESPEIHEQVMRIVVEALINVHKHAMSGRATITLGQCNGQTIISVQDDGPGFDVNSPPDGRHHFGLKVMQTRARRIGGELHVESELGRGTTVTLRWPTVEI